MLRPLLLEEPQLREPLLVLLLVLLLLLCHFLLLQQQVVPQCQTLLLLRTCSSPGEMQPWSGWSARRPVPANPPSAVLPK